MFIWEGVEYPNYTFDYSTNQLIHLKLNKPNTQYTDKDGYKITGVSKNGEQTSIRMHRLIYWMYHPLTKFDLQVDHIDRNVDNNDVRNLRLATPSQQQINRNKFKTANQKYVNVNYHKPSNKWRVRLSHDNKRITIGSYNTEREGAIAYNNYIINNNLNNGFRQLNVIEPKKKVICIRKTNA